MIKSNDQIWLRNKRDKLDIDRKKPNNETIQYETT